MSSTRSDQHLLFPESDTIQSHSVIKYHRCSNLGAFAEEHEGGRSCHTPLRSQATAQTNTYINSSKPRSIPGRNLRLDTLALGKFSEHRFYHATRPTCGASEKCDGSLVSVQEGTKRGFVSNNMYRARQ